MDGWDPIIQYIPWDATGWGGAGRRVKAGYPLSAIKAKNSSQEAAGCQVPGVEKDTYTDFFNVASSTILNSSDPAYQSTDESIQTPGV